MRDISKENAHGLFGTSGIRGLVDEFLTPELATKAGLTFATFLSNQGTILVGRDVRLHSELIHRALTAGLLAGGINVIDCGMVPTPAVLSALKKYRCKAAVMVTGSHMPAPTAGLLFFLSDTGEMDSAGELRFEEIFRHAQWRRKPWNELGSLSAEEIKEPYIQYIKKQIGEIGDYRIVVDPGNGAAYDTLGLVLESLGCEVITINGKPDGVFPSRSPYPQPSTLGQLSSAVVEAEADLGVGTDSDGDRAIFVAGSGQILWGDITGALFVIRELSLHDGARIISTVNTSSIIQRVSHEHGGTVTVTKVGPPAMAEALRSHIDAVFAVEESGKYIWPKILMYGDAALASGKLLEIMKVQHKSLEELQSALPKFHLLKQNVPCRDELKSRAMGFIIADWKGEENAEILTIDGLRVTYPDYSWFLVRFSGTEPALRCYGEGPDSRQAQELLNIATRLAQDSIAKARRAKTS